MFFDQDAMLGIRDPERPVGSHKEQREHILGRERTPRAKALVEESLEARRAQGADGRGG